jgi:D-ribose pyranose/furanose isomerase RbsD
MFESPRRRDMEGITEVKAFLEKNKDTEEVKALMASYAAITEERLGEFLKVKENFESVRSHFDRYAEKAVKTHDEKKRAEIDEEISKKVAELGKKEKMTVADEVAEIKKRLDSKDGELARERVLRQLEAEAASRKLVLKDELDIDNPKLTLESGIERLDARVKRYAEVESKKANELLAGGFKPGSGNNGGGGESKVDVSKMDSKQRMAYEIAEAEKRDAATRK